MDLSDSISKINLTEKFGKFQDRWSPHILAQVNNHQVKIAKVEGEFVWHEHDNEDELFYVLKGVLFIDLKNRTLELHPGEMTVIPRGIPHRPRADEETWILLLEPDTTMHTGDVDHALTNNDKKKI